MSGETLELWRLFPYEQTAQPGEPYSPTFVPRPTGRNRFDLPDDQSRVLYLAESAEHAVAEYLQVFRGRSITDKQLQLVGRELALARVSPSGSDRGAIADLCDPAVLAGHEMWPDRVASRDRFVTQPLARHVWDLGFAGLRWWSSFWGDWHTVVLFTDRLTGPLEATEPEVLTVDTPALRDAADALEILVS